MPTQMVRYRVAEEGVADVERAIKATVEALAARRPDGVRYEYSRRAGSAEFVALLELDEGVENPLLGIEEARDLQSTVAKWVVGDAPRPQPLELLGSYGVQRREE